jgi:flagellar biosynthesis/type III secretory pathway protein FliH
MMLECDPWNAGYETGYEEGTSSGHADAAIQVEALVAALEAALPIVEKALWWGPPNVEVVLEQIREVLAQKSKMQQSTEK